MKNMKRTILILILAVTGIALMTVAGYTQTAAATASAAPPPVTPDAAVSAPALGATGVDIGDAGVIILPLLIVGLILKNAFPAFPNRFIPLLTLIAGTGGFVLKTGNTSANGIFTAFLVAASATGIHSGFKNTFAVGVSGGAANLLAVFLGLSMCLTGCTTAQTQPDGTVAQVYDPVKTQAVKDALQAPLQSATRRIIMNSPQHSEEIARYFRSVGAVFCAMKDSGQFDPTTLVAGLDKALPPQLANEELAQYLLDFKVTASALYNQFWNDRFRAELPADQWPYQVADLFCASIDQGLKDAGQPGVR
jgi:hypothetical protein